MSSSVNESTHRKPFGLFDTILSQHSTKQYVYSYIILNGNLLFFFFIFLALAPWSLYLTSLCMFVRACRGCLLVCPLIFHNNPSNFVDFVGAMGCRGFHWNYAEWAFSEYWHAMFWMSSILHNLMTTFKSRWQFIFTAAACSCRCFHTNDCETWIYCWIFYWPTKRWPPWQNLLG